MSKLLNEGTLLNKSKTKKLDYKKKGKNFEIDVYHVRDIKTDGKITKRDFYRINDFKIKMTETSLLNYLYTELYID